MSYTCVLPRVHEQGVKQSVLSVCLSAQKLPDLYIYIGHLSDL